MELGADRQSILRLAAALAVLAVVTYWQCIRDTGGAPGPRSAAPPPAADAGSPTPAAQEPDSGAQAAGRFRPRLGGRRGENAPDPLTADATLRTGLLAKVRGIDVPSVQRDIFNFGRPKPAAVEPLTEDEERQAQARLGAAMRKLREQPKPPPAPAAPPFRPPDWKYFGMAGRGGSNAERAFLLDGEEILVATEGSVLQGRYRIESIGLESVVLADIEAGREFSIRLEAFE